jgi:hypothetical protein
MSIPKITNPKFMYEIERITGTQQSCTPAIYFLGVFFDPYLKGQRHEMVDEIRP